MRQCRWAANEVGRKERLTESVTCKPRRGRVRTSARWPARSVGAGLTEDVKEDTLHVHRTVRVTPTAAALGVRVIVVLGVLGAIGVRVPVALGLSMRVGVVGRSVRGRGVRVTTALDKSAMFTASEDGRPRTDECS